MSAAALEQRFYFGPPGEQLFAACHQPTGAARGVAVLLCNTWGFEEQSCYLMLREWAKQLSADGWPCMRFDHWGTGDSAGDALAPQDVSRFVQSISLAIDELKARSGVSSVVLLGVRAGFPLAWLAAASRTDVVGLIAVAPVLKGRGYIRELKALQLAGDGGEAESPHWFQSGGYVMSLGLRDSWQSVDLTKSEPPAAQRLLLLDRPDMPSSPAWVASLREVGWSVEVCAEGGYAGMVAEPHRVRTPQALLDVSRRWLHAAFGEVGLARLNATAVDDLPRMLQQPDGLPITESWWDKLGQGVGVLTVPMTGGIASGQAVLLLNAGSNRRIGLSRSAVELARRWGAQSMAVLRMDLGGIGDADPYPGRDANMSYPHEASLDIRRAIDRLLALDGVRQVHVIGLCSGAYHALKAARDGHPLASITMINPLVYLDAEGLIVEEDAPAPPHKLYGAAERYKQGMLDPAKWRKVLTGQVDVGLACRTIAQRLAMSTRARFGRLQAKLGMQSSGSLPAVLNQVIQRGVGVHFIFAASDPGLAMLKDQAGMVVDKQRPLGKLTLQVIEGADHVFVDIVQRERLMALLDGIAATWVP